MWLPFVTGQLQKKKPCNGHTCTAVGTRVRFFDSPKSATLAMPVKAARFLDRL